MRSQLGLAVLGIVMALAGTARADEKSGLDDEGFVQRWLVLAPIPFGDGQNGADALDKQNVKNEAKLKPKAGDKIKVGGKELVWKAHQCKEHFLEFNEHLGATTEDSVGYAVTFIVAPEEMKNVKMKTGSDDQGKVYLNGKEVFKNAEARALDKDQDTTEVTLIKGVNVLVFKVVNEKMDWSCCLRFTDKNDKPLTNLKSQTAE
jgi:hypothetical protein